MIRSLFSERGPARRIIIKCLLPAILFLATGCSGVPSDMRDIIGVYKGTITYSEEGGRTVKIDGHKINAILFSDLIPTSSPYRVCLTTGGFIVPDVYVAYRDDNKLVMPELQTRHNLKQENNTILLLMGESTADIGFPIPLPVEIKGIYEDGVLKLGINISASFGIGKNIEFEGKKKKVASAYLRWKNLLRYNSIN